MLLDYKIIKLEINDTEISGKIPQLLEIEQKQF